MLDKIRRFDDQILIIEPTIVGGSAQTGRTRAYHLHYLVIMLGYLGRLPFLAAPDNTLDTVPVDWVAAVISDVIIRGKLRQGVLRLASGDDAITVRQLYDAGYAYYCAHDPVPGHVIPKISFAPAWALPPMLSLARHSFRLLNVVGRRSAHRRRAKQIALLEGYLPYLVGRKRFDNERSTMLIRRYTGCGPAPLLPVGALQRRRHPPEYPPLTGASPHIAGGLCPFLSPWPGTATCARRSMRLD